MKLLVVDDDDELCELLSRALGREQHEVSTAGSLAAARVALAQQRPDVLILDLQLPDGSGLELLRERKPSFPVLILSAAGEVSARVDGLDAGADDYLVKPFAVAELRARVRALSRRSERSSAAVIEHEDVRLDVGVRRAYRAGLEVLLTAREWAIVETLAAAGGAVVGREQLLTEIWGEASDANSASLDVLLARIRRKLGRTLIRTLRGEGHALG